MSNSQSFTLLELDQLSGVNGGAPDASQAQLRELASSHCPATYAKFKSAPTLTRAMGERCLDEAGLGMFKGRLDAYFPKR